MNYFVALFFIMLVVVIGFLAANAISLWRSRPQGAKARQPLNQIGTFENKDLN